MSIDARVIAGNDRFRIVRQEEGNKVTYITEKHDGFDGLGVERWRELRIGEADNVTRILRDYIIQEAVKQEKQSANNRLSK